MIVVKLFSNKGRQKRSSECRRWRLCAVCCLCHLSTSAAAIPSELPRLDLCHAESFNLSQQTRAFPSSLLGMNLSRRLCTPVIACRHPYSLPVILCLAISNIHPSFFRAICMSSFKGVRCEPSPNGINFGMAGIEVIQ